ETPLVRDIPAVAAARSSRARAVSLIGPVTVACGLVWGILQPYRLTILHPRGESFWWLLIEPPLLAAAAGVIFALVVAKPLLAGGAELGLVHGRLKSRAWRLTWPLAFIVTGLAFIVHEQNPWLFARSAFLHHLLGWTFLLGALVPLALVWRPRSAALQACMALTIVAVSVMLFADRDVAAVFGHLSPLAGPQHR